MSSRLRSPIPSWLLENKAVVNTSPRYGAGFRLTFIFFGGKGGVGKTTCAAARAIASANRGERVLAVSTDPAHSLGDALGVRLSSRPSIVRAGRHTLRAVELDAPRAFARWLADHRQALGDAIEHGTWLDRHDVDAVLDLPVPGVDELVGMVEIANLARGSGRVAAYDEVVIDTAPTGHTLRLLAAPETVATVAEILDHLQEEHRIIRRQFARSGRPEAADRLITLIAGQARDTGAHGIRMGPAAGGAVDRGERQRPSGARSRRHSGHRHHHQPCDPAWPGVSCVRSPARGRGPRPRAHSADSGTQAPAARHRR